MRCNPQILPHQLGRFEEVHPARPLNRGEVIPVAFSKTLVAQHRARVGIKKAKPIVPAALRAGAVFPVSVGLRGIKGIRETKEIKLS